MTRVTPIPIRFGQIIEELLALNLENQERFKTAAPSWKDSNRAKWLRDFGTVHVGAGLRVGRTSFIKFYLEKRNDAGAIYRAPETENMDVTYTFRDPDLCRVIIVDADVFNRAVSLQGIYQMAEELYPNVEQILVLH